MLQAVIMAGGVGSRLRPLTCNLPKPMARLCGRPNIEYILDLLHEHHVTDAAVTVQYLPHCITENFEQEEYRGIRLTFVEETDPLGTAGSVKNAARDFAASEDAGDFIVISGDAMCDFDLTAALHHHKSTGAAATIVVKAVDDPREYGLVDLNENGDVRAFVEKPCFSQAVSNLANTGVYILSQRALALVPSRQQYDFAGGLFPRLLAMQWKIAAYEDCGYWCDIGDIESYRRCQQDMLRGLVRCHMEGVRDNEGNFFRTERPQGNYTLHAPVYIGEKVEIGEGAVIEAMSVIDSGVAVCAGARVSGSVLLPHSYVGHVAALAGAVVCEGASVRKKAMLFENAVLGADAIAGEGCVIRQNVRVWTGKHVQDGETLRENLQHGAGKTLCFEDEGLCGEAGVELTPELAVHLGLALGSVQGRVGVGCTPDRPARVLRQALISGILSAGADALDFGASFESMFRFNLAFCGMKLGVFLAGGDPANLRVFTSGGLPATRPQERAIESALHRGEYKRCSTESFGEASNMNGMRILYENELIKFAPHGLCGIGATVKSANRELENMMKQAMTRLGAHDDAGFVFQISPDGSNVSITLGGRGYLPHSKALAIGCLHEFGQGQSVALPFNAPRVMNYIAEEHGAQVLRYLSCPADGTDNEARELAGVQLWSRDALMLTVKLLGMMKERHWKPERLFSLLPEFDMASILVKTDKNPAKILRALAKTAGSETGTTIGEGVVIRGIHGIVVASPLKRGGAVRIMAEALNSETAIELCSNYHKMLKKLEDE